jgi:hypothetical protein
MEELTGTAIFWMLSIGLLTGTLVGRFIEWEGVSFYANVIWGGISGVVTGSIALWFGIGDGVLFALLGTIAVLFLVNVFHQHHDEDKFNVPPPAIRIRYR